MINETNYTNNPLTKEQEKKIDKIFTRYDTTDKPGCTIGVLQDGKFIYKKSFGIANLDYDIPITADSKFKLASMSKQFTAACIAILKLEGKLSLDVDVREYIPELPDYGKPITISHLLFHTSGLRDYVQLMLYSDSGNPFENYFNNKDCMKIICRQKSLDFESGKKFSYSNSGYILLAEIINRISGKSIREYAEEKIFKLLNMNDTYFDDDCKSVVKNKVTPYNVYDDQIHFYLHNDEALGGSGIISTLNDLQKWDNNFNNQKVGGKNFIDLMNTKGFLENEEILRYGFGLNHFEYKNKLCIGHSGYFFGFTTNYVRYPESKKSIILLCNRDADVDTITEAVADIILPNNITSSKVKSKQIPIELSESELDKFCGEFWSEESKISRRIYQKDGALYFWRWIDDESKLLPITKNKFKMDGSSEAELNFQYENNKISFTFLVNNLVATKFENYNIVSYTSEDLRKFEGKYYSYELDVTYKLKLESNKLVLFIKNKIVSELNPIMEDLFDVIEWGAYLKFRYDRNKCTSGFRLDQERAKNIDFVNIDK